MLVILRRRQVTLHVSLHNDSLLSAAVLQRQAAAATAAAAAARAEEEQKVVIRPARRPAVKPLRLRSPSSSDESEEEDSPSTRYRGVLPVTKALVFPLSLLSCPCVSLLTDHCHLSLLLSRDDVINQQRLPTRFLTSNKCSTQSNHEGHTGTEWWWENNSSKLAHSNSICPMQEQSTASRLVHIVCREQTCRQKQPG